jgi:hypothetical protein
MPSKQTLWARGLFFFLLLLTMVIGFGQGGVRPERDGDEVERDNPVRRQQWFLSGRQMQGQNTAALLARAFRQRQRMLAAIGTSPAPLGPISWQSLGPNALVSDSTGSQSYGAVTGRATSVAIDQGDGTGNTVYIGGAFGGVWKSMNATAAPNSVTWSSLIDSQITDAVGAIAIQPGTTGSTAVVLVGTGEPNNSGDSYYGQGILRSADGGTTWNLISSSDAGVHTFQGLGFSKITFNNIAGKTSTVVATAAATDFAFSDTTVQNSAITRGPYFSTDAGLTWHLAAVTDSGTPTFPGSTTDVAFDAAHGTNGTFFALIRAHGMYSSTDGGATWQRLANQPQGTTPMNTTNCPTTTSNLTTCPLFRGHIAVRPVDATHSEIYVAYVGIDSSGNEIFEGAFRSIDGGGTWSADLGETGYLSPCGPAGSADTTGCGTVQAAYNMYLTAIPNGATGTDLYLGGINIYRCRLANNTGTCGASNPWANLTHVYGCGTNTTPVAQPSHVHPDQHGMDFLRSNPNFMYFANDGGIYSTQDGAAADGTCAATNAAHWQNLNVTLGPMTEFVSFSQDVTSPASNPTVFGGTQDNGSPGFNGTTWANVNNGDGGFNDIDPTNPNIWYTSNTDVSVQRCSMTPASSCNFISFPLIVDNIPKSQGGNNNIPDASSFYTPFMLDPRDPHKVIIATCRVWRGSSSDPTAWPGANSANALSFNLDTGTAVACTSGNVMISALAAGGPVAPSGSAAVIYAGREDGRIFVSTAAESGQSSFVERSISAATGSCPNNRTGGCKIGSIAVDPSDATGNTAVATIMGFMGAGVGGHVWRTTNAGMSWTSIDISGSGLPDAPADSVVIDPFNTNHIFVGTDVGVFESTNAAGGAPTWAVFGTGMPPVPATRLLLFDGSGARELRVSTYGRGIWQAALPVLPFFSFQAPSGNTQTIVAGQTATYNLTLSSINSFAGAVNFTCAGAPNGATCTASPNPMNLTAGATNVALTVTVTNTTNSGVRPSPFRGWPLVFAAVLAGVLIGAVRKPRQAFPMALGVFMIAAMLSCGGGGGGGTPTPTPTPAPTPKPNTNAVLSITGTSGSVSRTFPLYLTVTH